MSFYLKNIELFAVKVLPIIKSLIFVSANIIKMLEILIVSMVILLICFALLGITVIVKKNGRFPNTHVGGNPALQRKGIKCAQDQDFEANVHANLFERMSRKI